MAANLLSFDFIRGRLSAEQLADLAVSLGLRLECGGNLVSRDGEIVCSSCGFVWDVENTADYVPFPEYESADGEGSHFEGHWQPCNTLAFLRGLGDPALANGKGRALMRVLAKSPNGATNLGLRARQVKTLIEWEDPPQLRRVLSRISLLLMQMGQRENWLLANYAGNLTRKIVAFKLLTKTANKLQAWRRHNSPHNRKVWIENPKRPISYKLGGAIIAHTIEKFGLKTAASDLKVETEDLQLIQQLENITQKPKHPKPAYQATHSINSN